MDDAVLYKTGKKSCEGRFDRQEEIWGTVTGKRLAPASYIRKDSRVVGGYGHPGVLPVLLVVEEIADIEIRPVPTYDYTDILLR